MATPNVLCLYVDPLVPPLEMIVRVSFIDLQSIAAAEKVLMVGRLFYDVIRVSGNHDHLLAVKTLCFAFSRMTSLGEPNPVFSISVESTKVTLA